MLSKFPQAPGFSSGSKAVNLAGELSIFAGGEVGSELFRKGNYTRQFDAVEGSCGKVDQEAASVQDQA